jgi:hypothetical protein
LFFPEFPAILRRVVAKVYIVSFRTLDDRRPSKFIVLADNMRSAINKRGFDNNIRVWLQIKGECHRLDPCSCSSRLSRTRNIIASSKT